MDKLDTNKLKWIETNYKMDKLVIKFLLNIIMYEPTVVRLHNLLNREHSICIS